MNRRKFLSEATIGIGVLSAGCLDIWSSSDPSINIVNPESGESVGEKVEVEVDVQNFEIQRQSVSVEPTGGYVVLTVDEGLSEGDTVSNNDGENVYRLLDGELSETIEIDLPEEHTINAYLSNSEDEIQSASDSVTFDADFDIVSEILLGVDGLLLVEPGTVVIPEGAEITFVWNINGVNLNVTQTPDDAEWEGVDALRPSGYTYTKLFDTPGVYEFECEPHTSTMQGRIRVE